MKSSTSRRLNKPPEVEVTFTVGKYKLQVRTRVGLQVGWDAIANLAMNSLDKLEEEVKKYESNFLRIKTQTKIPFKET